MSGRQENCVIITCPRIFKQSVASPGYLPAFHWPHRHSGGNGGADTVCTLGYNNLPGHPLGEAFLEAPTIHRCWPCLLTGGYIVQGALYFNMMRQVAEAKAHDGMPASTPCATVAIKVKLQSRMSKPPWISKDFFGASLLRFCRLIRLVRVADASAFSVCVSVTFTSTSQLPQRC